MDKFFKITDLSDKEWVVRELIDNELYIGEARAYTSVKCVNRGVPQALEALLCGYHSQEWRKYDNLNVEYPIERTQKITIISNDGVVTSQAREMLEVRFCTEKYKYELDLIINEKNSGFDNFVLKRFKNE